jgi:hypothetical protein
LSIRRISNNYIEASFVEDVAEPGVPEEELVVAGEVEGAEFAEYVGIEVLDAELLGYGVAYLVA